LLLGSSGLDLSKVSVMSSLFYTQLVETKSSENVLDKSSRLYLFQSIDNPTFWNIFELDAFMIQ